jgi:hypothetical protein
LLWPLSFNRNPFIMVKENTSDRRQHLRYDLTLLLRAHRRRSWCSFKAKAHILLGVLTLGACHQPNSSGLTREQAEAVLRERGYTYPTLGPAPDGWSGYAVVHGYQMNLTVGKNGIVTFKP